MSRELLQLLERHRELAAAGEMVDMFLGKAIRPCVAAQAGALNGGRLHIRGDEVSRIDWRQLNSGLL